MTRIDSTPWRNGLASAVRKVPEVTVWFWIVKLLTTAMGESTTDYFVYQINPYVAVALACIGLAVALILQLRARCYIAWVYWLTVVMVAVFGTMVADVMHVVLGIPYLVSTVFFAGTLAGVFAIWYASERTAYVVTRPLGASVADWLGKPFLGGLGLGDGKVAVVLTILIAGFVGYLAISRVDVPGQTAVAPPVGLATSDTL